MNSVRRTALALAAVGFFFVFFAARLMGVDLLIDAVGYLLVFNGVRPFRAEQKALGWAQAPALALVLVAGVELFVDGGLLAALGVARLLLEALLLALTLAGLGKTMAGYRGFRWDVAVYFVFGANIAFDLVRVLIPMPGPVVLPFHAALVALLVLLAWRCGKTES